VWNPSQDPIYPKSHTYGVEQDDHVGKPNHDNRGEQLSLGGESWHDANDAMPTDSTEARRERTKDNLPEQRESDQPQSCPATESA
jgi:hypothetical protein